LDHAEEKGYDRYNRAGQGQPTLRLGQRFSRRRAQGWRDDGAVYQRSGTYGEPDVPTCSATEEFEIRPMGRGSITIAWPKNGP